MQDSDHLSFKVCLTHIVKLCFHFLRLFDLVSQLKSKSLKFFKCRHRNEKILIHVYMSDICHAIVHCLNIQLSIRETKGH